MKYLTRKSWAHALLLVAAAGPFAGCNTAIRAPICAPGEMQLPPGSAGTYHMAQEVPSAEFSGTMNQFSDVEFSIQEQPQTYEFGFSRLAFNKISRSATLLQRMMGNSVTQGRPQKGDGGDVGVPVMELTACKIGANYYSQQVSNDGTYQLSRLDLSSAGITMAGLVFEVDELRQNGFKVAYVPTFGSWDNFTNSWQMNDTRIIVDNAGVTAADRDRLVALSHPTTLGMVFSRVTTSTSMPRPYEVVISVPRGAY